MTNIHNPIIRKEKFDRWRTPISEPGICLVIFREGNDPYIRLDPGERLSIGAAILGKYKAIYKIDITEHSFKFDCKLPCKDEVSNFRASVHVVYRVDDPINIVERNVDDARSALEPLIESEMRSISRQYEVKQSAAAEQEIKKKINGMNFDIGLKVDRFFVKLNR